MGALFRAISPFGGAGSLFFLLSCVLISTEREFSRATLFRRQTLQ